MALAQNEAAMLRFSSLSPDDRRALIRQAQSVESKQEMQELVESLADVWADAGRAGEPPASTPPAQI